MLLSRVGRELGRNVGLGCPCLLGISTSCISLWGICWSCQRWMKTSSFFLPRTPRIPADTSGTVGFLWNTEWRMLWEYYYLTLSWLVDLSDIAFFGIRLLILASVLVHTKVPWILTAGAIQLESWAWTRGRDFALNTWSFELIFLPLKRNKIKCLLVDCLNSWWFQMPKIKVPINIS